MDDQKNHGRLTIKDFLKLPDEVQGYIKDLARVHGVGLKKYLRRIPNDGIGWGMDGKDYCYKKGEGIVEVSCDEDDVKGG